MESNISFWIATTPRTEHPRLDRDVSVDVAVIGGGIVGIVCATLLKEAGRTVALLDRGRILEGVTGHTTAKLTSQHGLLYDTLIGRFGEERARMYAEAQEAAIAWVAGSGVDCDLERMPAYVWASSDEELRQVEAEVEAARRLGLPASFEEHVPLNVDARGGVRFDEQAQFHPRKLLLALAERIPGGGSHVFEQTMAHRVREGDPCAVEASGGTVTARDVVVATHMPFADRGLFFTKAFPHRGYAVAGPADRELPQGVFINAGSPTRSVRTLVDTDGSRLLLVGGDGHKAGAERDTERHHDNLIRFGRERLGLVDAHYRWSTQDYYSVDEVPFVGRLHPRAKHVFTATGFGGWGMTNGVVAAMLIAAEIGGDEHEWQPAFDSNRLSPARRGGFYKENAAAARHLVARRLTLPKADAVERLAPGEGVVARVDGETVAVHRRDDGSLAAVSAACTHLGCLVQWNGAERTWDCPCHGSRFAAEGEVLHGPAVRPLEPKRVRV